MSRLPGAAVLGVGLFITSCSWFRAPTQVPDIRIAAIEPESIGLDRQVFRMRLVLSNPNTVALRVASARLRLDLEDIVVGTGELMEGFSLPAGEEGSGSIRIVTDLFRQGPQLLTWLMSGDGTLDYRVSGYIDLVGLGLGRVRVDENGRVPLAPSRGESRDTTAI
jgi:LEA14-like dessication related protein